MEISINHDQLRELLELVHIGTCVRNSVFEDMGELDERDSELESNLLEQALSHGMTEVEECEHGFVHLSVELEEGCYYLIETFGENYFWSEFMTRLENREEDGESEGQCHSD